MTHDKSKGQDNIILLGDAAKLLSEQLGGKVDAWVARLVRDKEELAISMEGTMQFYDPPFKPLVITAQPPRWQIPRPLFLSWCQQQGISLAAAQKKSAVELGCEYMKRLSELKRAGYSAPQKKLAEEVGKSTRWIRTAITAAKDAGK